MLTKRLNDFIAAALVFLFIYTSISKLLEYDVFTRQLSQSPFITQYAGIIAWSLPLSELVIATLLMIPKMRLTGFYISFFLLCLFTCYLIAMLNFSPFIPCSCGGILNQLSWQAHIIFNIAFILFTTTGIIQLAHRESRKPGKESRQSNTN
jgi:uncharacterized membrane protein YphA (DoxX/SURF4 family)